MNCSFRRFWLNWNLTSRNSFTSGIFSGWGWLKSNELDCSFHGFWLNWILTRQSLTLHPGEAKSNKLLQFLYFCCYKVEIHGETLHLFGGWPEGILLLVSPKLSVILRGVVLCSDLYFAIRISSPDSLRRITLRSLQLHKTWRSNYYLEWSCNP